MPEKERRNIRRKRKEERRRKRREEINTSEMAAKEGKRSQITTANTVRANNVCVRVRVCRCGVTGQC